MMMKLDRLCDIVIMMMTKVDSMCKTVMMLMMMMTMTKVDSMCKMDLRKFPMDTQECEVRNCIHDHNQPYLGWHYFSLPQKGANREFWIQCWRNKLHLGRISGPNVHKNSSARYCKFSEPKLTT